MSRTASTVRRARLRPVVKTLVSPRTSIAITELCRMATPRVRDLRQASGRSVGAMMLGRAVSPMR